ncbi:MAG: hypothetical protein VX589_01490 [Myxococcota bacterium]|nr:hypothetical protein [Myxococcota bacterium]
MNHPIRLLLLGVSGILACETTETVTDRVEITAGATTAGHRSGDHQQTHTQTGPAAAVEAGSNQPSSTSEDSNPMTSAGIQSSVQPTAGEGNDPSPMMTNATTAGMTGGMNEGNGGDPGGDDAPLPNINRGGHNVAQMDESSMDAPLGGTEQPSTPRLHAGQRADPVGGHFEQNAGAMDQAGADGQAESSGGVVFQGAAGNDQPDHSTGGNDGSSGGNGEPLNSAGNNQPAHPTGGNGGSSGGNGEPLHSAGNNQPAPSTGGRDESMNSAGTVPGVGGEMSVDGGGMPAVAPRCDDRERNGTETDVDCGGQCDRCPKNSRCAGHEDCLTGQCLQGVCRTVCHGPAACDAGEVCICPSGWGRDADPCSPYGPMDAFCLPCDQFAGPYCGFEGQPEQGQTYAQLCDFPGGINGYLLRGECPPECSADRPCPGACDACQAGRCVSLVDEDGICPF